MQYSRTAFFHSHMNDERIVTALTVLLNVAVPTTVGGGGKG